MAVYIPARSTSPQARAEHSEQVDRMLREDEEMAVEMGDGSLRDPASDASLFTETERI